MTVAVEPTAPFPDNLYDGEWTKNPKIVDLNDHDSFVAGADSTLLRAFAFGAPVERGCRFACIISRNPSFLHSLTV